MARQNFTAGESEPLKPVARIPFFAMVAGPNRPWRTLQMSPPHGVILNGSGSATASDQQATFKRAPGFMRSPNREPVTPRLGDQQAGVRRVRLDLSPEPIDMRLQCMRGNRRI